MAARTTEDAFFAFVKAELSGADGAQPKALGHVTDVLNTPRFPGLEARPKTEPLPPPPPPDPAMFAPPALPDLGMMGQDVMGGAPAGPLPPEV